MPAFVHQVHSHQRPGLCHINSEWRGIGEANLPVQSVFDPKAVNLSNNSAPFCRTNAHSSTSWTTSNPTAQILPIPRSKMSARRWKALDEANNSDRRVKAAALVMGSRNLVKVMSQQFPVCSRCSKPIVSVSADCQTSNSQPCNNYKIYFKS